MQIRVFGVVHVCRCVCEGVRVECVGVCAWGCESLCGGVWGCVVVCVSLWLLYLL